MHRRGWGVVAVVTAAVLLAAAPTDAATNHHHRHRQKGRRLPSLGKVIPAGRVTRLTVVPGRAVRVSVRHGGRLTIPRGAVARRARFVLRPYRGVLRGGAHPAALGLGVHVRGAKLRKPLTWTQRVGHRPDGTVAVFAHRADDGVWELRHATVSHGRMTLHTKQWSINLPSWLNPKAWAEWVGQRLTAFIAGTTSPWSCPHDSQWASAVNHSSTVHVCTQANDDNRGERAEVRIKSNRGYFQQVTVAGPRDYVWVKNEPDAVQRYIGAFMHTDPASVVYLPPGDDGMMTVGFRRPSAAQQFSFRVETSYRSIALDVAYQLVDIVAGDLAGDVKYGATSYILAHCAGILDLGNGALHTLPSAASAATFGRIYTCMATAVAEELVHPGKALEAARSLNDPSRTGLADGRYADQLVSLGRKLHVLGTFLWARPLLQQGYVGSYDQLINIWQKGRTNDIDVSLLPRTTGPGGGSAVVWAETAGADASTWTDYAHAGGTRGLTVRANTAVWVACKVQGFRVADGDTWWYRIASFPWSGSFYVSADAFYNNGQTSGSLRGTPFVDPAVAGC